MIQAYAVKQPRGRLERIAYDPGTPAGSPFVIRTMLDFCARHRIEPVVEYFPMSRVNEAWLISRQARRATATCWRTILPEEQQGQWRNSPYRRVLNA